MLALVAPDRHGRVAAALEQRVVLAEQWAESCNIAMLQNIARLRNDRANLIEQRLIACRLGLPAPTHLADGLARFTVRLMKDGELVEEGSGKNALRSPARSLGELAAAIARQPTAEPLAAGELISSGTLTTSTSITAGETWSAVVDGIDLPALTLRV